MDITPSENRQAAPFSTENLLFVSENKDAVSGYPFETPAVRKAIIEEIREAIKQNDTLTFVVGDIDYLKALNDKMGHETTNIAIRRFIESREEFIKNSDKIKSSCLYRPQAGGDEFKALIRIGSQDEVLDLSSLESSFSFQYGDKESVEIQSTCGVVSISLSGNEDPAKVLQELETKSSGIRDQKKLTNIFNELDLTIESGRKLLPEEYAREIAKRWGWRRTTPQVLEIIGLHLIAKTQATLLAQK